MWNIDNVDKRNEVIMAEENKDNNIEFKVPDTVNMNDLEKLVTDKKKNKELRIAEILKRMQLPKTLENMAKAERVIERRVEMGYMTSDYDLVDDEEKSYSNGTASVSTSTGTTKKKKPSFKEFLQDLLGTDDSDTFLNDLLNEKGGMVTNIGGRPVLISYDFILSLIDDFEQLTHKTVPDNIKALRDKETLSDREESDLMEFMANNKDFSLFVVSKKEQGDV